MKALASVRADASGAEAPGDERYAADDLPVSGPGGPALDVPEIDVDEAAARQAGGTPVIDVREPDEYIEGHVTGAPLIPVGDVVERVDEIPAEGEVLIICKSGARSRRVAEFLRGQGVDAINVGGGTMAWIDAGHPITVGAEPS
jgi:thioredoxin